MTFVKKGIVVPLGSAGQVDDVNVSQPNVTVFNDKIYCYYTAAGNSPYAIALAISEDGF